MSPTPTNHWQDVFQVILRHGMNETGNGDHRTSPKVIAKQILPHRRRHEHELQVRVLRQYLHQDDGQEIGKKIALV